MEIIEPYSERPAVRNPTFHLPSQIITSFPAARARRTSSFYVPRWKKAMRILFLWTLFLYPFSAVSHIFYMVPQVLFFLVGSCRLLAEIPMKGYTWRKFDLVFLAFSAVAFALVGELASASPEYSEVVKLAVNVATILLLLFLPGVIDLFQLARWLPRFAVIWLSIVITTYIRSGTTFIDLVLLFSSGSTVSSSHLYGFAEPLGHLFLTKNIAAMYVVATYGLFLYSARSASEKIKLWQHVVFLLLVLTFASRQGVLSVLAMLGIARMCSDLPYGRRWTEFALAGFAGAAVFLATFNLNSSDDGASARLGLWTHFMQHASSFVMTGQGLHGLNESLASLDIDNYHMFFMNQIGAYGVVHCLAFNLFLVLLMLRTRPARYAWLLIAPYWLNVCFQTYGYEYGNLFLLVVAADRFHVVPRAQRPITRAS